MKYVSIDIETTGIDWTRCQVLEIGAVIEDSNNLLPLEELPTFRILIKHPSLHWEEVARKMHVALILEMVEADKALVCQPQEAAGLFKAFLLRNGYQEENGSVRVVAAGKNFAGFDRQFLDLLPNWKEHIRFSRRVLDPAPFYLSFKTDTDLPSLEECKRRAGLSDISVKHKAVSDALDVVQLLRPHYNR